MPNELCSIFFHHSLRRITSLIANSEYNFESLRQRGIHIAQWNIGQRVYWPHLNPTPSAAGAPSGQITQEMKIFNNSWRPLITNKVQGKRDSAPIYLLWISK